MRCSFFISNLNIWIIGILNGLRDQHKFALLLDIAQENIDMLLSILFIPYLYIFVEPIVLHILRSVQHTPVIFKRFLKHLAKHNMARKEMKDDMIDTIAALMSHFPDNDEYKKIVRVL